MITRKEISIAAGIVGTAAIALVAHTIAKDDDDAPTHAAGGHDHAAMLAGAGAELHPVLLDDEAARRIGVTFAVVERGPLARTVRAAGVVAYDETRLVDVSPRVEGWAEEVYADFTGAPVRQGEPLLALYSPALVAAQEELILARRLADRLETAGGPAAENARELLDATRRRLGYWGIDPDQIAAIELRDAPERTLVLRAPADGVVVEKNVVRGSRVEPGTVLYRIADLSRVWVEGEVFEKDLALIEAGRRVDVTVDAYPGERLEGTVAYIHPTLSAESRTARIRVELPNPGLRLKPGMYASLTFDAPIHDDGLHIPRSAVLTTGTRSLVFVRAHDGSLVPREVTAGRVAGEEVEILDGLAAGDVVVSAANFLIDAEANLGTAFTSHHDHGLHTDHDGHTGHDAHPDHLTHTRPEPAATHHDHGSHDDPGGAHTTPAAPSHSTHTAH